MRKLLALVIVLGCSSTAAPSALAFGSEADGKASSGACSFLNDELMDQVSTPVPANMPDFPPEEEPAGTGSACFYRDIVLQIDPFTPAFIEQTASAKDSEWMPVDGVGDAAYFRDNRGEYAELMGATGERSFTIQMDVPINGTAEAIKPNVITLAKAIAAQLQ
jgi:hypothetical protein